MGEFSEQSSKHLGIPLMLVHSDMQPSNLLFSKENPDELAAVLDWQFAHAGVSWLMRTQQQFYIHRQCR